MIGTKTVIKYWRDRYYEAEKQRIDLSIENKEKQERIEFLEKKNKELKEDIKGKFSEKIDGLTW